MLHLFRNKKVFRYTGISGIAITKLKILIVDDEPVLLRSLAFTLRRNQFSVTTSISGAEALHLIEEEYSREDVLTS